MGESRMNLKGVLLRRVRSAGGQGGSVLIFVLAIVLMLSIAVFGMINMSMNAQQLAVNMKGTTQSAHKVDGALEQATNEIRNRPASCMPSVPLPAGSDYVVECIGPNAAAADAANPHRRVDLLAYKASEPDLVGKARIRYTDFENGNQLTGYTVEVCDWLLMRAVSNSFLGCS